MDDDTLLVENKNIMFKDWVILEEPETKTFK